MEKHEAMKIANAICELSEGSYFAEVFDDEGTWEVELCMEVNDEAFIIIDQFSFIEDVYAALEANRFGDEAIAKLKAIMDSDIPHKETNDEPHEPPF